MAPAFAKNKYDERLCRVRQSVRDRNLDALGISDPDNIKCLTGYDTWSFYTPQVMLVGLDKGPFWVGLEMDVGSVHFTIYLNLDQTIAYPEYFVQRVDTPSTDFIPRRKSQEFGGEPQSLPILVYTIRPSQLAILRGRSAQCHCQ